MTNVLFLAWRNLFRNGRRTIASLITIAIGSAGLLIYQGFNEGIMNQYRENTIRVRYGHGQVFPSGYRGKVLENPMEAWIKEGLTVENRLKQVQSVMEVFPRVSFYAFLIKGNINLAGRGEGIDFKKESKFFTAMNFVEGKDIEEEGGIILGKGLANSLNAHVGDLITVLSNTAHGQLNGLEAKVSGVFHTGSQEFDNSFFRIGIQSAQSLLDTQAVEHFALQTSGVEVWPAVSLQIQTDKSLEAIAYDDLDAVYYKNAVAFLESQFQFIRTIMLLIVALGIFNTIAVGLLERASEVGALRANGESRKRLCIIFVAESALLGVLGGIFGIIAATVLDKTLLSSGIPMPPGPGITRSFLIFLEVQTPHYFQALFLPAITTLLASFFPIRALLVRSIPNLLRVHS